MTLLELLAEAVFLGTLFWLMLLPGLQLPSPQALLGVLLVSPGPVVLVLYLSGYYLTRPVAGIFGRADRTWVYGTISALLFAIHMLVVIIRLRPDITPAARAMTMPFLIGGTAIVFGCAYLGDRWLRRWMHIRSVPTEVLSSGSAL